MHGWEEMRIRYSGSHGLQCVDGMLLYAMLCYVVPCHAVVLSVRRGAILRYHLQCCGEVDWLIDRLDGTLQYIDADRDLEGG